jgi:hypothetical protein
MSQQQQQQFPAQGPSGFGLSARSVPTSPYAQQQQVYPQPTSSPRYEPIAAIPGRRQGDKRVSGSGGGGFVGFVKRNWGQLAHTAEQPRGRLHASNELAAS